MSKLKLLTSIGDTIVEAMIATAVMGAVMAGGYAIASRSLKASRASQERGEALKVAESQVEIIKQHAAQADGAPLFSAASVFCVSDTGTRSNATNPASPTIPTQPGGGYDFSKFTAQCQRNFGAETFHYYLAVRYSGTSQDVFTVVVAWDSATGDGQDNVTLRYKVHS